MATRGSKDYGDEPTLDEVTDAVRSLVEVMRTSGLTELDVSAGSVSIRLRTPKGTGGAKRQPPSSDGKLEPSPPTADIAGHVVTAPMIGTFYASPAPGEPPFVRVGDRVAAGQTIGIIEAMKIMNEIVADHSGVVVEVLVDNAQAVEYGSPLLRLDLEGESAE
ncbi:MAG TPA: acetyl-CoA carboxylase biotin carboxyl carrier protein [Thermomicrobiales bacterium]